MGYVSKKKQGDYCALTNWMRGVNGAGIMIIIYQDFFFSKKVHFFYGNLNHISFMLRSRHIMKYIHYGIAHD